MSQNKLSSEVLYQHTDDRKHNSPEKKFPSNLKMLTEWEKFRKKTSHKRSIQRKFYELQQNSQTQKSEEQKRSIEVLTKPKLEVTMMQSEEEDYQAVVGLDDALIDLTLQQRFLSQTPQPDGLSFGLDYLLESNEKKQEFDNCTGSSSKSNQRRIAISDCKDLIKLAYSKVSQGEVSCHKEQSTIPEVHISTLDSQKQHVQQHN